MIFYNYQKVLKVSKKSTREFLKIMHYITFRDVPRNHYDSRYKYCQYSWKGRNFIINPEPLFTRRYQYKDADIIQYITLTSYRNYGDYKLLKKRSLNLQPFLDKTHLIQNNPLLTIKGDELLFLFEEEPKHGENKNGY